MLVAAVVVPTVEAIKSLPQFNNAYSAMLALALGVLFAVGISFTSGVDVEWYTAVQNGVIGALTASGGYAAISAIKKKELQGGKLDEIYGFLRGEEGVDNQPPA